MRQPLNCQAIINRPAGTNKNLRIEVQQVKVLLAVKDSLVIMNSFRKSVLEGHYESSLAFQRQDCDLQGTVVPEGRLKSLAVLLRFGKEVCSFQELAEKCKTVAGKQ